MNFWDFSSWGFFNLTAVLLLSLLAANMLKRSIRILEESLIPTSVLGGMLLLVVSWIYRSITGGRMFDAAIFAGKGSNGLYALLEGYVRTLQTFGVKLLGQAALVMPVVVPVKPPKYQAPAPEPVRGSAKPNCQRLITETDAVALAAEAEGSVCIPVDAILTPSARDVFTRARLEIRRCGR